MANPSPHGAISTHNSYPRSQSQSARKAASLSAPAPRSPDFDFSNPIFEPGSFADSILSFKPEENTTIDTIAQDYDIDNTTAFSDDETSTPLDVLSNPSTAPANTRLALPPPRDSLPGLPAELVILILRGLTSLFDLRSLLHVSPEVHYIYLENKKAIVKSVLMNAVAERKRHLRGREREKWEREGLWRRMWTDNVTMYVVEKLMSFESAMWCAGEHGLERD